MGLLTRLNAIKTKLKSQENVLKTTLETIGVDTTPVYEKTIFDFPTASNWNSVAYGNGVFVSIANGYPYVMVSTDGLVWTQHDLLGSYAIKSIAFGNGKFIAIGYNTNKYLISMDGIDWVEYTKSIVTTETFGNIIIYGNGTFIASGYGTNYFFLSTDGITWTSSVSSTVDIPVTGLIYANSIYIGITASTYFVTSVDGTTWVTRNVPISSSWCGIAYGAGRFVVISSSANIMALSKDGITWTSGNMPSISNIIIFANNIFLAVTNTSILTSVNGFVWDIKETGFTVSPTSIIFSNNTFVIISPISSHVLVYKAKELLLSTITDWVTDVTPHLKYSELILTKYIQASYAYRSICYGNGIYIAVMSNTSYILVSSDGLTWNGRSIPVSANWQSVCYGNGRFVAVSYESTRIITSTDGITWVDVIAPVSSYWQSVCYGNGRFVAVTQSSTNIMYSYDGIVWTLAVAPISAPWRSICYGNELFVAVAGDTTGYIMTSTDGITWSLITAPASVHWYSVCYGNGRFIAIANDTSTAMISDNGINWRLVSLPVSALWLTVAYGNGMYLVTDSTNRLLLSYDGIVWSTYTLPVSGLWYAICYGNGAFVAFLQNTTTMVYIKCNPIASASSIYSGKAYLNAEEKLSYGNYDAYDNMNMNFKLLNVTNFPISLTPDPNMLENVIIGYGENIYLGIGIYGNNLIYYKSLNGTAWDILKSVATTTTPTFEFNHEMVYSNRVFKTIIKNNGIYYCYSTTNFGVTWTTTALTGQLQITSDYDTYYIYGIGGIISCYSAPDVLSSTVTFANLTMIYSLTVKNGNLIAIGPNTSGGVSIIRGSKMALVEYSLSTILGTTVTLVEEYTNIISFKNQFIITTGSDVFVTPVNDVVSYISMVNKINSNFGFNTNFKIIAASNGVLVFAHLGSYDLYTVSSTFDEFDISTYSLTFPVDFNVMHYLYLIKGIFVTLNQNYGMSSGRKLVMKDNSISIPSYTGSFISNGATDIIINDLGFTPSKVFITLKGNNTIGNRVDESIISQNDEFIIDGIICNSYRILELTNGSMTTYTNIGNATKTARIITNGFILPLDHALTTSMIYDFTAISGGSPYSIKSSIKMPFIYHAQPSSNLNWVSMAYGNGLFVAVAFGSTTYMTSSNGITWASRIQPVGTSAYSICFGNGLFVIVGTGTIIAYSSDGVTWTSTTAPVSTVWRSVCYGNGLFVAVASGTGDLMTSPDGITWTARTIVSASWITISYGNGLFVAFNQWTSTYMTSPDGITWTTRTAPGGSRAYTVVYFDGTYFVLSVMTYDYYYYSTNGIDWTAVIIPGGALSWRTISSYNGNVLIPQYAGTNSAYSGYASSVTGPMINKTLPLVKWFCSCVGNGKIVVACYGSNNVLVVSFE